MKIAYFKGVNVYTAAIIVISIPILIVLSTLQQEHYLLSWVWDLVPTIISSGFVFFLNRRAALTAKNVTFSSIETVSEISKELLLTLNEVKEVIFTSEDEETEDEDVEDEEIEGEEIEGEEIEGEEIESEYNPYVPADLSDEELKIWSYLYTHIVHTLEMRFEINNVIDNMILINDMTVIIQGQLSNISDEDIKSRLDELFEHVRTLRIKYFSRCKKALSLLDLVVQFELNRNVSTNDDALDHQVIFERDLGDEFVRDKLSECINMLISQEHAQLLKNIISISQEIKESVPRRERSLFVSKLHSSQDWKKEIEYILNSEDISREEKLSQIKEKKDMIKSALESKIDRLEDC